MAASHYEKMVELVRILEVKPIRINMEDAKVNKEEASTFVHKRLLVATWVAACHETFGLFSDASNTDTNCDALYEQLKNLKDGGDIPVSVQHTRTQLDAVKRKFGKTELDFVLNGSQPHFHCDVSQLRKLVECIQEGSEEVKEVHLKNMHELLLWDLTSAGSEQLWRFVINYVYEPEGDQSMAKFTDFSPVTNLWVTVLDLADRVIYAVADELNQDEHVVNFAANMPADAASALLEKCLPKGCVIEIKEVSKKEAQNMVPIALHLKAIRELIQSLEASGEWNNDTQMQMQSVKESALKLPGAEDVDKYVRNVEEFATRATKSGFKMVIDDMDEDHPLFWVPRFVVNELCIVGVKIGFPRHSRMMTELARLSLDEHHKCVNHIKHFARNSLNLTVEGSENVEEFCACYGPSSVMPWASSVVQLIRLCEKEMDVQNLQVYTQGGHKILSSHIKDRCPALFTGTSSGGTGSGAFAGSLQPRAKTGTKRKKAYCLVLPFGLSPDHDERAQKMLKAAPTKT